MKFADSVVHFKMRKLLKFGWIYSKGYGVMGVLNWGDGFPQNYQCPLVAKLYVGPPKVFEVQKTCLGSSITMPSLVGIGLHSSHATTASKNWVFLFVCLWVCPSCTDCAHYFAMKTSSIETILILLDRGRFVAVQLHSTFFIMLRTGTLQNAKIQKWQNLGFSAARVWQNKLIKTKFGK